MENVLTYFDAHMIPAILYEMECIRRRLQFAFTLIHSHTCPTFRDVLLAFSLSLSLSCRTQSEINMTAPKFIPHFTYWNYMLPCSLTGEHHAVCCLPLRVKASWIFIFKNDVFVKLQEKLYFFRASWNFHMKRADDIVRIEWVECIFWQTTVACRFLDEIFSEQLWNSIEWRREIERGRKGEREREEGRKREIKREHSEIPARNWFRISVKPCASDSVLRRATIKHVIILKRRWRKKLD